jgi:hypothetical protein
MIPRSQWSRQRKQCICFIGDHQNLAGKKETRADRYTAWIRSMYRLVLTAMTPTVAFMIPGKMKLSDE